MATPTRLVVASDDGSAEMSHKLELIIDAYGLAPTVFALAEACDEKALHIEANWQDELTARVWARFSLKLAELAMEIERAKL
jgi:hypothetical protein